MAEIELISFETISKIWSEKLWPGREMIEPVSAMLYLGGHNMDNFNLKRSYLGLFVDEKLTGVNSGHECADNTWRSRGLWVDPEHRGKGYGVSLLRDTIKKAAPGVSLCWSLPRKSSWNTYYAAGFIQTSDWFETETSEANAYCRIVIR